MRRKRSGSASCLWLPQKALSTLSIVTALFPPENPWVREKEDRALGSQNVNVSAANQGSLRGVALGGKCGIVAI